MSSKLTLEQWVTYLAVAMLVVVGVVFGVYYPRFSSLDERTEPTPKPTDEVYLIALSAANKGYGSLTVKTGRNPFLPAVSIRVTAGRTRTPIIRTPRTTVIKTPTPTRRTTPPPPSKVSFSPTPTPYVLPLTLSGILKQEDTPRKAILKAKSTGEVRMLTEGETFMGVKVVEITPVSVKLLAPNNKVYVLGDPNALGY